MSKPMRGTTVGELLNYLTHLRKDMPINVNSSLGFDLKVEVHDGQLFAFIDEIEED